MITILRRKYDCNQQPPKDTVVSSFACKLVVSLKRVRKSSVVGRQEDNREQVVGALVRYGNKETKTIISVVKGLRENLVSREVSEALRILKFTPHADGI
jgi:hypothetical protein